MRLVFAITPRCGSRAVNSQIASVAVLPEPFALLAAVLRGEDPAYPASADSAYEARLLQVSAAHGVDALLDDRLASVGAARGWPDLILDRFRTTAIKQAAVELAREHELRALLDRFGRDGVNPILLKGTPLAYSLYPQPQLRPRCDTDILIPVEQRVLAERALRECGHRTPPVAGGAIASYQRCYTKPTTIGIDHVVDLHWRASNRQLFAQALTYGELASSSIRIPALGPVAKAPNPLYALLLALIHRIAHLPERIDGLAESQANRLIWLYDIHLLAEALSEDDWRRLIDLANRKGLRSLCADGLRMTQRHLHTAIPEAVLRALSAAGDKELSARYLRPSRAGLALAELRALPTWGERVQLVKDWFLPPAEYMLHKYRQSNRWLLPWLYLRRVSGGLMRRR